jgi:hypothetical protein
VSNRIAFVGATKRFIKRNWMRSFLDNSALDKGDATSSLAEEAGRSDTAMFGLTAADLHQDSFALVCLLIRCANCERRLLERAGRMGNP